VVDRHCAQAVRRLGAETACLTSFIPGARAASSRASGSLLTPLSNAPASPFARSVEIVRRDASGKNLAFLGQVGYFADCPLSPES
jgi:hypothetical protein